MSESQTSEPEDEVTIAVQIAKAYVKRLWAGEGIHNLGLEEVTHEGGSAWHITIGFSRPWDRTGMASYGTMFAQAPPARTYKSVRVDTQTKEATSVSNRDTDNNR